MNTKDRVVVHIDGSFNEKLNFLSIVSCHITKNNNIVFKESKKIDFNRFKNELSIHGANFIEFLAFNYAIKVLSNLNLKENRINIRTDNKFVFIIISNILNNTISNFKYPKEFDNLINKLQIKLMAFTDLSITMIGRKRNYVAHELCNLSRLKPINEKKINDLDVEKISEGLYRVKNKTKDSSYIVNIEEKTCECLYFIHEGNYREYKNGCKHIEAVIRYIENNS